eukprot:UN05659
MKQNIKAACMGETVAALRACRNLAGTDDPFLKEVFTIISKEEADHAGFGWRVLRWAVEKYPKISWYDHLKPNLLTSQLEPLDAHVIQQLFQRIVYNKEVCVHDLLT